MDHASSVRLVLEYPLKHCPEVLVVGIAHITTAFNLLQYEVVSRSGLILQLWHANRNLLLRGFMDTWTMYTWQNLLMVDETKGLRSSLFLFSKPWLFRNRERVCQSSTILLMLWGSLRRGLVHLNLYNSWLRLPEILLLLQVLYQVSTWARMRRRGCQETKRLPLAE